MSIFQQALNTMNLGEGLALATAERLEKFAMGAPSSVVELVDAGLLKPFIRSAAISEYFANTISLRPEYLKSIFREESPIHPYQKESAWDDIDIRDEAALLERLRRVRQEQMLRILWHECGLSCAVPKTLARLSSLADCLITIATRFAYQRTALDFGTPTGNDAPDQLMVLAMGKLGGRELNLSSDVDLILAYSGAGQTTAGTGTGARSVEHQDFFVRQTRKLVDYLTRPTPEGIVYRVDTRLRPFGASGRLCASLGALEQYLAMHGREWERYAYVKCRPIVACAEQAAELMQLLKPFVYRRYLDFGVFDGLRDMKTLIQNEVGRAELRDDIKRGPGGIRQIEFIVQTMQLVYGGKQPTLQSASIYQALSVLSQAGFLPESEAHLLRTDYEFLRRIENGLQALRDQQVHALPTDKLDRERISLHMNTSSWQELQAKIDTVRDRVQSQFDEISLGPSARPTAVAVTTWWDEQVKRPEQVARNIDTLSAWQKKLLQIHIGGLRSRMDAKGRKRLDRLINTYSTRIINRVSADAITAEFVRIIEGIGRRSAYFALINENPQALDRLMEICDQLPKLARQIAHAPLLLDSLVDPRGSSIELSGKGLVARFKSQFGKLDPLHEEHCLLALREFKQSAVFDVAIADMEEQLPIMKISDRLTEIAELILHEALAVATTQLHARFGSPRFGSDPERIAEFAIVGYGKLGGLELSYTSDLDLVFLYDDGGQGETSGPDVVDNSVYFMRLAQRLIHSLTVTTAFGALYQVDMRLRPSGKSGLLVSRFEAFDRYQAEQAWTWEHQALLRARGVGGSAALLARFEELRKATLQNRIARDTLQVDVQKMRAKMKANLDKSTRETFDLKHGPGGLTDLEFLVQYLVLANSHIHPALAVYSDNIRQIEALEASGIIDNELKQSLSKIYLHYRHYLHHSTWQLQPLPPGASAFAEERQLILSRLDAHGLL